MESSTNYRMERRPCSELTTGLVLYGETEPAEMQIENLWKIIDRRTGAELIEPRPDLSEFSTGDIMYPSMRKPDVQARWDQNQREYESAKEQYSRIKRMCHARFIRENRSLPLTQGLAKTVYGRDILAEMDAVRADFVDHCDQIQKSRQSQHPYAQTGTGDSIHDELAKDGIEVDPNEKVRTIAFNVPGVDNPFTILATARDEKWRIVERLLAFESDDLQLQYGYDAGGRLNRVWQGDRVVEQYQYGDQGERLVSETLYSDRRHYEYDDKLRLIQAGDTTYTYNAYGSLAEKRVENQITKYDYLSNGQLCKVVLPDGRIIEYVCDKHGVRTAKKVNGKVVEKYKWKNFGILEAITDGAGKNKKTFARDEESNRIVMTSEGKKYYLAVDQVGSVFMVADDQGNEVNRIIYDSFGNVLVDTNEQFYLSLGFASGLTDKDTGLVHFGFREYDPEIGRFTAQDPLGYGGGDVDVYGYCLDDPINFNDTIGLEAGGIGPIEFPPRRYNEQIWYIWRANEGACDVCKAKNNDVSETPTMERPHPNCKCQQVECLIWEEHSDWNFSKLVKEISCEIAHVHFDSVNANSGFAIWHRKYTAEEKMFIKIFKQLGDRQSELVSERGESRVVEKVEVRTSKAIRFFYGGDIEEGDVGATTNPWTGESVPLYRK